jgi:FdhD protein
LGVIQLRNDAAVKIARCEDDEIVASEDAIAVEEPLEIFIDGAPCYLTMRSPGHEKELAVGYCFSEGFIDSAQDVDLISYCADESGNRVDVLLNASRRAARCLSIGERRLPAYTSCGICGKELISDICMRMGCRESTLQLDAGHIRAMLHALEEGQEAFDETGCTHAAALFDEDFELLACAEDIGRHNALDKATGGALFGDRLAEARAVAVTSRLSFEMVQKVGRTGAQVLIGMSSPTSLAVELAKEINLTVVGFASQRRFNVYSGFERVRTASRLGVCQ